MTLLVVLLLAPAPTVSAAPPPARYEPDREPRTVDDLYLAYRYLGLPLPPPDATPVRWTEYRHGRRSDGTLSREEEPQLGLVVRKRAGAEPAVVWDVWGERKEFAPSRLRPIPPTVACLDGLDWLAEDWLSLAAWSHHLGWDEVARAAFARGRTAAPGGGYTPTAEDKDHVLLTLRTVAWKRAYEALTEPGTDRRKVRSTLRLVHDNDPRFRDPHAASLLRSLDLTLRPPRARAGTVEALIDGLTESPKGQGSLLTPSGPPDAYDRLVERGFDAVPALIAHLGDERLTRAGVLAGVNNGMWVYVGRVGTACQAILEGLSDYETRVTGEVVLPGVYQKKAAEWFERVKRVGEERWAAGAAAPDRGGVYNVYALRVVRAKYPRRLPALYRAALAAGQNYGCEAYANEVADSTLDRGTKLALLREGADHRAPGHRLAAVEALGRVDRAEFRRALRAALDWLATAKLSEQEWEQVGTDRLLTLVARAEDPGYWPALARACRAAGVSLRMRLLGEAIGGVEVRDPAAVRGPLRLLVEMLPDRTVRDGRTIQTFPYPGVEYTRLAVGDYAAIKLAEYLGDEVSWDPNRTEAGWGEVRARVRAAVERELGGEK